MITGTNYADFYKLKAETDLLNLKKKVQENPESSLARFLLLYQYKKTNDPEFEKFAKQSVLYFSNLNWIQFQLSNADLEKQVNDFKSSSSETQKLDIEEQKIIPDNPEESISQIIPDENFSLETKETLSSELKEGTAETATNNPAIDVEEKEKISAISSFAVNQNLLKETKEDEVKREVKNEEDATENSNAVFSNNEDEFPDFEPLHTVDYFASQGIKINEEALMNDKLGKQMKSFTDWLKSMKKLHPGKLPEQNEVIEKIIQSSAEESNTDADILTEAMAEVLIKQDKKQKAVEMYQKLSLMNPSKSSYFAAKIESLKSN